MRLPLLGLVVAVGLSGVSTEAQAQIGGFNDPFFAYYSFYLPRQQAQALQPGPEATINAAAANRQQYAATNRNGMFDPLNQNGGGSAFSDDFTPSGGGARRRTVSAIGGRYGVHGGNLNGLGPQGYYGGSKLTAYYKDLKTGRGRNANVSVIRGRGFSGGGAGGLGLNTGLPGPR